MPTSIGSAATPPKVTSDIAMAETRLLPRAERVRLFTEELDALDAATRARLGAEDVAHVKRVHRFSLAMEVLGRATLHFLPDPVSFAVGVVALAVHRQLQWEIGHPALHGAYDRLEGMARFSANAYRWDLPIDEESWAKAHNWQHHAATNVAGRDPDTALCTMRLAESVPRKPRHRHQLFILLGLIAPVFTFVLNLHVTGVAELLLEDPPAPKAKLRKALRGAFRKYIPYYAKNYVLFPLLAALSGFQWVRVLVGVALAELLSDIYTSFTFVVGHIGHQKSWPEGTRTRGRGEWYLMQLEGTRNHEVCLLWSLLGGGVDRHIEHHLFPRLPMNRLRQIAPQVRQICEKYGFPYRTNTWPGAIRIALRHLARLARNDRGLEEPSGGR